MAIPRSNPQISPPRSYADLSYSNIQVSNVPETSGDVTPVVVVTLYRPKHNNAFTDGMMEELEDFYGRANIDDRIKCVVMTGHGKMFCAGLDLQQGFNLERKGETERTHRDEGGRVGLAIHNCSKPTIGAIQGHAVGVGITMTLPMAIRVAWSGAKIGFVFSRRGLVCEAASSFFLPRLIGYSRTVHLFTTGATYPANHKLLDGLFTEMLEKPDQVLPRALELAKDIAENTSSVSTFLMREMVWRGMDSAEETHILDSRLMGALRGGEENNEGVNSFLEKRPVNFKGNMARNAPSIWPWHRPIYIGLKSLDPPVVKPKL